MEAGSRRSRRREEVGGAGGGPLRRGKEKIPKGRSSGMRFEELASRGRWSHVSTARIYLDEGLQELASVELTQPTHPRCAAMCRSFPLVSQLGTRGRGGES